MSGNTGSTSLDQSGRLLRIETPLGTTTSVLTEVVGEDAISEPFLFDITIATTEEESAIRSLLGGPVTIWLGGTKDSDGFPVNGIVRRVSGYTTDEYGLHVWRLELVPRLWLLSCIADCRIFQNKSVQDILETIFGEQGITDYEFRVSETLTPMEYCVQWRETTLAFVSRLLERFGLFYWHEHVEGKHTLVVADSNKRAQLGPSLDTVYFGQTAQTHGISALSEDYSYRPGKWTMTDYDFTAPTKSLQASTPTIVQEPASMASHEIYDFPGIYTDTGAGKDITKMHVEIEEALFHRMHGQSGIGAFAAGQRCKAQSSAAGAELQDFLLVRIRHRGSEASHRSGNAGPPRYENDFTAVPMDVPYRHPTRTPQPLMHGPQTAIVTGPSGDVVYTDQYGRVKVQFHWDRVGKNDDHSSCWIRVSQSWAGRSFGTMHLPRIGQEVIVDFLEGNPDRPIVTGRVYNGDNPVPYALPANKTQSGIKTHSVPNGGNNELRFEDKGGSEEIYLHAQKDLTAVVENNETRTVKKDQTETVQGNVKQTVDQNVTVMVNQDVSETIMGSVKKDVTGSVTQTIVGSVSQTVMSSVTQTYMGSLSQTVMGGITILTPATMTVTATGGYNLIAPTQAWQTGPQSLSAYGNVFAAMGQQTQTVGNSDAVIGINMAVNGVAQTVNGVHMEDIAGAEVKNIGVQIKTAATAIKNAAMHLFT